MMSLAHFDEIYEICCEMIDEEEVLVKVKPPIEPLDPKKAAIPENYRWWEEAVRESVNEKERELVHV